MAQQLVPEPFSLARLDEASEFVVRSWTRLGNRSVLHLGDLHWMLRAERPNFEPESDIRIWRDASHAIAGMAWFDGPASGDIMASEPWGALLDAMLAWLESTHLASEWSRNAPHFSAPAWADDAMATRALGARGYARASLRGLRLHRPVSRSEPAPLPGGMRWEPASAEPEFLVRRCHVQQSAFGSNTGPEAWLSLRSMGAYREDLDVLLVDAAGRPLAAALCWYDKMNRAGAFEPVGVVREMQGQGLGKLVMAEGLRRLAAAGAETAIVGAEADNPAAIKLYQSAGFEITGTRVAFTRQLA